MLFCIRCLSSVPFARSRHQSVCIFSHNADTPLGPFRARSKVVRVETPFAFHVRIPDFQRSQAMNHGVSPIVSRFCHRYCMFYSDHCVSNQLASTESLIRFCGQRRFPQQKSTGVGEKGSGTNDVQTADPNYWRGTWLLVPDARVLINDRLSMFSLWT